MVEDVLLCFHKQGSSPCLFAPIQKIGGRRPRYLWIMPISREYHSWQLDLLLVGPHTRLSASVSEDRQDSLDICSQASCRSLWSFSLHLGSLCSVWRPTAAELNGRHDPAQCDLDPRKTHEALHHILSMLACRILRLISVISERTRGAYSLRRQKLLRRLVEQSICWHILAHVEQARLSIHETSHFLAHDRKRLERRCSQHSSLCIFRLST